MSFITAANEYLDDELLEVIEKFYEEVIDDKGGVIVN